MVIQEVRHGDWMTTFTGKAFWSLDPRADEICIEDIAHALSMQCRFAGHTREFYSVSEHSWRVSHACNGEDALWGLLHDATEAYLQDIIRPVKRFLTDYGPIEKHLESVICAKFGLAPKMPKSVAFADEQVLATEKRDLLTPSGRPWHAMPAPLQDIIYPWSPRAAEKKFLARFAELGGKR